MSLSYISIIIHFKTGQSKILLSFLQIFSGLPLVLDVVPWPKVFLEFTLPLNVFNMDFLAVLAKSGCGLSVRFYDKFILHMTLPVGCLLLIVVVYFTLERCTKEEDIKKQHELKEMASKATILIILLVYPGLTTKIFTIFKCKKIEGIPGWWLVQDYNQQCYEGEHVTYMIVGSIFFCLYVLGIPLVMFLLLQRNKKALYDVSHPEHHLVQKALGAMYIQYEPAYWWFEIFLLLNKTMMCGGLVMAAPGTPLQVLISMLIMMSHLLVVLKLSPYKSTGEDVSAFVSSLTLTLTTLGGMILVMDQGDANGIKTFDAETIAWILLGISVLCIVEVVCVTVLVDCGVLERYRGKRNRNKNGDGSKVIPVSSADGKNKKIENNATKAWKDPKHVDLDDY